MLDAQETVRVGGGSYATKLDARFKSPQKLIYRTENLAKRPMPNTDWWSSIAWVPLSFPHYAHPLAMNFEKSGLRLHYPGNQIVANQTAMIGSFPIGVLHDLTIGLENVREFPEALVDDFSDWFVKVRLEEKTSRLDVSYGHGSPFVFARNKGGAATLKFPFRPLIWSGDAGSSNLGITIGRNHYGIFAPTGARIEGLGSSRFTIRSTKDYFSIAVLPTADKSLLKEFAKVAHAHVVDTKVNFKFEQSSATVLSKFEFKTQSLEGTNSETIFALYPHQWRNAGKMKYFEPSYKSVRGKMKIAKGKDFQTSMRFPGVLPAIPNRLTAAESVKIENNIRSYFPPIDRVAKTDARDTYWEGKYLGALTTMLAISEQLNQDETKKLSIKLATDAKKLLQKWLVANSNNGKLEKRFFYYDKNWTTLIGYPASYGSDVQLNDHHFHYGYFLYAAGQLAIHDEGFRKQAGLGPMLKLLMRDIASPDAEDKMFPRLRCFDPYAGHSWASGDAKYNDGNNMESSSEAMNAWCGMILLGHAWNDQSIRDLGICLYTNEMHAIEEYWFDVHRENFEKGFGRPAAGMVWGGKTAYETWFSPKPEMIHGINWLPIHGGSIYLGRFPEYANRNFTKMINAKTSGKIDSWKDLTIMFRALSNPRDALSRLENWRDIKVESGNSRANLEYWVRNFAELGIVERKITCNQPLSAVFNNKAKLTYCFYNIDDSPRTAKFSDGTILKSNKRGFAILEKD